MDWPLQQRMLTIIFETFLSEADWPIFQYVGGRAWTELRTDPREIYYVLSETGLVWPAIDRAHGFTLRDDTRVAVSLRGMMYLDGARDDLLRFVLAVRYVAERAGRFVPATATAVEELRIPEEDIRQALNLDPGDPALLRQGVLIRDQAPVLWTSFAGPGQDGTWSVVVNVEKARRFRSLNTVAEFHEVYDTIRAEGSRPWSELLENDRPEPEERLSEMDLALGTSSSTVEDEDAAIPQSAIGRSHASGEHETVMNSEQLLVDNTSEGGHDVFVSHASEDKESIARPLSQQLRALGYRVWFDEFELKVGSSLRRSIDKGLAGSRFGVVILSPAFFGKEWPQRELDGLVAQEAADPRDRILPVWHEVDKTAVTAYSPTLADRVAVKTADGLEAVVAKLADVLGRPSGATAPVSKATVITDAPLSVRSDAAIRSASTAAATHREEDEAGAEGTDLLIAVQELRENLETLRRRIKHAADDGVYWRRPLDRRVFEKYRQTLMERRPLVFEPVSLA